MTSYCEIKIQVFLRGLIINNYLKTRFSSDIICLKKYKMIILLKQDNKKIILCGDVYVRVINSYQLHHDV